MIVGQEERQVRIAFRQRQDEVAGFFLDRLDGPHQPERSRLGAFVGMPLQCCDHVRDGQFLAVVESDVVPDLERPDRSICRRLPGGGDRGQRSAGLGVGLDQRVAPEMAITKDTEPL